MTRIGLASPTNKFTVFYGERGVWWLLVKSTGPTGHGSRFVKGTAMGKLMTYIYHSYTSHVFFSILICNLVHGSVVNRFLEFRAEQEKLLDEHDGCKHASRCSPFLSADTYFMMVPLMHIVQLPSY
jgi:aminoacylase